MQKLSELLHSFRRASAVFAAATGLTKTRAWSCVCVKCRWIRDQPVCHSCCCTQSFSSWQTQTGTHERTGRAPYLLTKFLSLSTCDLSSVWCQWYAPVWAPLCRQTPKLKIITQTCIKTPAAALYACHLYFLLSLFLLFFSPSVYFLTNHVQTSLLKLTSITCLVQFRCNTPAPNIVRSTETQILTSWASVK